MPSITITLNDDGTIHIPDLEKAAQWCVQHRKGIAISVGACLDPAWQHCYMADYAVFMQAMAEFKEVKKKEEKNK